MFGNFKKSAKHTHLLIFNSTFNVECYAHAVFQIKMKNHIIDTHLLNYVFSEHILILPMLYRMLMALDDIS